MTNEEIVRDYKASAKPLKQIGILAELNGVDKSEIVRILREAGCELPQQYDKKPKAVKESKFDSRSIYEIAIGLIEDLEVHSGDTFRDRVIGAIDMVRAIEAEQ